MKTHHSLQKIPLPCVYVTVCQCELRMSELYVSWQTMDSKVYPNHQVMQVMNVSKISWVLQTSPGYLLNVKCLSAESNWFIGLIPLHLAQF